MNRPIEVVRPDDVYEKMVFDREVFPPPDRERLYDSDFRRRGSKNAVARSDRSRYNWKDRYRAAGAAKRKGKLTSVTKDRDHGRGAAAEKRMSLLEGVRNPKKGNMVARIKLFVETRIRVKEAMVKRK